MTFEAHTLLEIIEKSVSNPLPPTAIEKIGTKTIIIPILESLGWDTKEGKGSGEVVFELGIHSPIENATDRKRADIALYRTKGIRECVALIEVKRPYERLERHADQLYEYYAREGGIDLCVLTNAYEYWFWYPKANGSWNNRKFLELNLLEISPSDSFDRLYMFLGKDNLSARRSIKQAERELRMTKEKEYLEKRLPEIWSNVLTEPSEAHNKILEALSEVIREEHDIVQNDEFLEEFLISQGESSMLGAPEAQPDSTLPSKNDNLSKKRGPIPTAFILSGKTYQSPSKAAVSLEICKLLWEKHSNKFYKLEELTIGMHFSSNESELDQPKELKSSGYYLEKNLDAIDLLKASYWLLDMLGYDQNDFSVQYPEGVIGPAHRITSENESFETDSRAPKPVSFTLRGREIAAKSHSSIAQDVYESMWEVHSDKFSEIEQFQSNRRLVVSKSQEKLRDPRLIADSDYYLDLSVMSLNKSNRRDWLLLKLLSMFGYTAEDFRIDDGEPVRSVT